MSERQGDISCLSLQRRGLGDIQRTGDGLHLSLRRRGLGEVGSDRRSYKINQNVKTQFQVTNNILRLGR
jgi:hypothetical protein